MHNKFFFLKKLCDSNGRFKMLAVDQRGSLRKKLALISGKKENQIKVADLKIIKKIIIKSLAPYATAVLTDPKFGLSALKYVPKNIGRLLCLEESGPEIIKHERWTKLLSNWSVAKIKKVGASAVKLLLYYNPEASKKCLRYQQELALKIGRECQKHGLPFLLELIVYSLTGQDEKNNPNFNRQKPQLVIKTVREFSKAEYQVDILKLEFPVNLKFVKEYQEQMQGAMNCVSFPKSQFIKNGLKNSGSLFLNYLYTFKNVRQYLNDLNQAAQKPWVILSAGAPIEDFLIEEKLALSAGASGFLCGRAIWQNALRFYPCIRKIEKALQTEARENFRKCNNLVDTFS